MANIVGSDRPVAAVLQDILANVQVIFRAEMQLAKAELRTEALRARRLVLKLFAAGALLAYAVLFLLLAAVYALAGVVPPWVAAMIVGILSLSAAAILILTALTGVKGAKIAPKTVKSMKENLEWHKAPNR